MIEIKIKELLETVCPNKIFLKEAPLGTSSPYICYGPVSATHDDVLGGQSGYTQRCFQVDVYSKKFTDARTLILMAQEQLSSLGLSQIRDSSDYESDTGLFRETFEFFY